MSDRPVPPRRPTSRPVPVISQAPVRPLRPRDPVAVAIAAVAWHRSVGYAVLQGEDFAVTGAITLERPVTSHSAHLAVGKGLWSALEALLETEHLTEQAIDLFVESDAHRADFTALTAALPRISVQPISGRLAHRARAAARTETTQPVDASGTPLATHLLPRLEVACDGSVGRAPGQRLLGGIGWVAADGRCGYQAVSAPRPLDAELLAVRAVLRALPRAQALHLLLDNRTVLLLLRTLLGRPTAAHETHEHLDLNASQAKIACQVADLVHDRDVTLAWGKGHRLHRGAERLAVGVRRAEQLAVPPATFAQVATGIVEDSLPTTGPSTGPSAAPRSGDRPPGRPEVDTDSLPAAS